MRKYAVALLAIPVLLPILAAAVLRRSLVARTGVGIGIGAAVALAAIGLVRPPATDAIPPSTTIPLTQAAFQSRVTTDVEVDAPVTITFNAPMDRASVQASITVEPSVPVSYTWSAGDTTVAVAPRDHWAAGSYYTITVNPGALARSGRPSTSPARALFFTRSAPTAKIAVPARLGARVSISPMFTIGFDRAVDAASVSSGVRLVPAAAVQVRLMNDLAGAPTYAVTPTAPLAPDTVYRLVVDGVRDAHGATVTAASLTVRTTTAARVVRFRPLAKSTNVARDVAISVRFTEAMDPASTRKAFTVTAAGAPVVGSVRFAEGNTVLVLVPKTALPYGAKVVATVGVGAKTRSGAPIAAAASATFQTVAKPAAKVAGKPVVKIPRPSGGGSVGSGSWGAVERYYLTLMNCTRTGGWVTSNGSCSSPGGRNVAPLTLSSSISTLVSRPYAKRIAMSGDCSHFIGGNPGDRLRHAGFMSYKWAENIGCRQGSPMVTALAAQLFFQSEKPYNGGHYVNMMNAMYDRVGIGIWLYSGRTRLVIDFYHP